MFTSSLNVRESAIVESQNTRLVFDVVSYVDVYVFYFDALGVRMPREDVSVDLHVGLDFVPDVFMRVRGCDRS